MVAGINLAGDGGGNYGDAAFLQQVNGSLGFGGEGDKPQRLGSEKIYDLLLFTDGWNRELSSSHHGQGNSRAR